MPVLQLDTKVALLLEAKPGGYISERKDHGGLANVPHHDLWAPGPAILQGMQLCYSFV